MKLPVQMTPRNRIAQWVLVLLLALMMTGCKKEMELHSRLSESDANEVVAALIEHRIHATKQPGKDGVSVMINERDIAAAVQILNARGLPRKSRASMGEIFHKEGIISTPLEERARYIYALSQELEYTLSQIEGVIVARVHVVLPEKVAPGEPIQPSSAAVFIKHRTFLDPDVASPKIKRMVASSIPGLADAGKDNIAVVFMPAELPFVNRPDPRFSGAAPDLDEVRMASLAYNVAIGGVVLLVVGVFSFSHRRIKVRMRKMFQEKNDTPV